MSRFVQKFGGTSIADVSKIRKAAQIACEAAAQGHEVATVVSAMGHTTDKLISLADGVSDRPSAREMDVLLATGEQVSIALMSMAIQSLGFQARSFTGAQAGFITDGNHGLAKILRVAAGPVEAALARGEIAVVAGFQGITNDSEVTTLGRGGSDTTAVALASALKADRCDIYTDVDGVYTADPNMLSNARRLPAVSYEEMLELSSNGAQVLAARSVELAMETCVPLRVRSTFTPNDLGTLIGHGVLVPEYTVCGLSCDMNQAAITLRSHSTGNRINSMDGLRSLFARLQELNIFTDMVMLLAHEDEPSQEVAFTVETRSLARVESLLETYRAALGDPQVTIDTNIARVSVVGSRLTAKPEVVANVFEVLQANGIPVSMVASGDIRVSIVLAAKQAREAVRLIHDKFGLGLETSVA